MAAAKILNLIGSILTIGFGIWHIFVPSVWKWYSYINADAPELVLAIRATNLFFSLCLIIIGALNILFAHCPKGNDFAFKIMLGVSCFLWIVRVVLQLIYPQGSVNPALQYGMLFSFTAIFLCFGIALVLVLAEKA